MASAQKISRRMNDPAVGGSRPPPFHWTAAGLGLFGQKNVIAATTPIATAFKFGVRHRKKGLLNRLPIENFVQGGRWRHHSQSGRAPKKVHARKSMWDIAEPPGTFCIEQAQKIIRGSELTPPLSSSGVLWALTNRIIWGHNRCNIRG
jgi:hypothetical protein